MILTELDRVAAYRMHLPKWAATPISGEGAKKLGGRANRPGVAALYLSLNVETAVKEYRRTSTLFSPGTLVSYQATLRPVVDFRKGFDSSWDPIWEDFYCDWRELWFNGRIEPPSWVVGDEVIASGAKGILFQSHMDSKGTNLLVYTDTLCDTDFLSAFDPQQALPRNQDSWQNPRGKND